MSTNTPNSPGDPQENATAGSARNIGQSAQSTGAGGQRAEGGTAQKTEEIRERAREVQNRIEEGYHELEERYDDARMQLRNVNDTAVSFIRENPVMCLVGAVGVGYFVGRLASRRWLT